MGEPKAGSELPAAIVVTAFGPRVGTTRGVDHDVTPTLPCQGPMTFHDFELETRGRVGVFETGVDDAVDYGFPPAYA